ncbi:MAG: hypothetical protein JNK55_21940 [Rubrivivax sp.]|nr:hypothetical protein [Rubrivivax sp.]
MAFSVTAAGDGLSYQWQRSTDGGSSWTDIVGANASSYTLDKVDATMDGWRFRVVVKGTANAVTTAAAVLSVQAAAVLPVFTVQPASATVTAPAVAGFSVTVGGTPAPSLQWQFSADGGQTFANLAAATAASYTTGATTVGNNGWQYRVVATNSAGSVTSSAATLSVQAAPAAQFVVLPAAMTIARVRFTATRLQDGRVLIAGGMAGGAGVAVPAAPALDSAELYDPAKGSFEALPARMTATRTGHAAALLANGQVLITGGQIANGNDDGSNSAEIFNPATKTFSALPARMVSPRGAHTATTLPDGRVLLAGGFNQGPGSLVSDAELYDPASGQFTALAAKMAVLRDEHAATLLPDGKVLLAGGVGLAKTGLNSAEIFDPQAQTFSAVVAKMSPLRTSGVRLTTLADGGVLVSGGGSLVTTNLAASMVLDSTERYDPATQTFTVLAARMSTPRWGHEAVRLADGSVLIVGGGLVGNGSPSVTAFKSAEVYK